MSKTPSFLSKVLTAAEGFFKGLFADLIGAAAEPLETAVVGFVKTDVGQLAVDSVQYASTLIGDNPTLKAAAVAKLKADLATAGKDITTIAESTLNLFIELAYTYVKGTVAAIPAALAAAKA